MATWSTAFAFVSRLPVILILILMSVATNGILEERSVEPTLAQGVLVKQPEFVPQQKVVLGVPNRILIPSLNIDVVVKPGYFNPQDETWTITDHDAYFATPSVPANDTRGNTFIYGHNNWRVFEGLAATKPDTEVTIYTDNGHTFIYGFMSAVTVSPTDVSQLNYSGSPPVLTLQTCSGAWNESRTLWRFSLKKVIPARDLVAEEHQKRLDVLKKQILEPTTVGEPKITILPS